MLATFQKGVASKVIKIEADISSTPDLNEIQALAGPGRSAEQGVHALELARHSGAEQAVGRPQSSQSGPEADFRVDELGRKFNHTRGKCSIR